MEMQQEWLFFLCSALYGAECFVVYDLIRAIRRTWEHGKILIAAEDIFFWAASGIFLFTRLYHWNNGILRWYFFLGLFLGMLLYAVTISDWVLKFVSFFLKRLKMFFLWGNIIVKRITAVFLWFLRIKNGKNVKSEEKKTTCQKNEPAE